MAIKLAQLRMLLAVAEAEGFGEAGLRLGVSQSAISHAIATLEAELGVVLLNRGRHGAQLTPVGERIVRHSQTILAALNDIEQEASRSRGLKGGDLRIGTFRSFATHVLPETLAHFQQHYPNVNIVIKEYSGDSSTLQSLLQGTIDVGFIYSLLPDELEGWEVARDEYQVLFPPNIVVPEQLEWEFLQQFPMIVTQQSDTCFDLIQQHFNQLQKRLRTDYKIQEDSTIVGMVLRGLGIAVMAQLAAAPLPPTIQTRSLPVPLERIIRVAVLREGLHSPALYAFLELLRQTPTAVLAS